MIRQAAIFVFLLQALVVGCTPAPFQKTAPAELETADPRGVLERFKARMPDSFELLTTVVFEYNGRKFSGIGTVQINRSDRVFKVAGMNPMGVKLFELSGDRNSVMSHYSIADFTRYGDIAAAVGNDIRRIYFDLVPGPEAKIRRRNDKLVVRQPSGPGLIEYVFAGTSGDLIEKSYYEEDGIAWKASYYEYRDQNGKRCPQGVVFIHYQYGYRLTVRHKEFRFENN